MTQLIQRFSKVKSSPIIVLFVGILAVSSASLLIRFSQKEAPSLVIAAARMTIAAIIATPFCLKRFITEIKQTKTTVILLLILSGIFLALHFASWITSLEYTSVASSVVFVTTAPLWVSLLSPIFLKERITKKIFWGLVISLLGSVIVGLNSSCTFQNNQFICQDLVKSFQSRALIGNGLALAGAFLSAGYLMVGRKTRNSVSLISYIYSVYSVSAVVLIFLVVITGQKITGYSPQIYLWMIALAVIPQIIGHSAFNWALKYLSAAYVSIALLGEPIGTVILTMMFLQETPAFLEITGGILILVGIIVATQTPKQQINEKPPLKSI